MPRRFLPIVSASWMVAAALVGACDGSIFVPDEAGGSDDPGSVGDPPGTDPTSERPVTPVGRLTRDEYVATARAAFESAPPSVSLPNDSNDGVFTSNAASEGIGDFNGYVTASEQFGSHYAGALAAACDWSADAGACAQQVFAPILPELYRGADRAADYTELAQLVRAALDDGAPVETALVGAVSRALLDERFLFHIEYGGVAGSEPDEMLLTGLELASRLAYLVLDAPPDATLRTAAAAGLELDQAAIDRETERLFDDPRARDQMWEFASEWLGIPAAAASPDDAPPPPAGDQCNTTAECIDAYGPTATDCVNSQSNQSVCQCGASPCAQAPTGVGLEQSMHEETRRFVEYIVFDSDAPLSELFTANYSFIDATLAAHYGVPAPATDWERYEFPPEARRRGVLTHASFLTANGGHLRDVSWIFRGKIVYERLFCGELPPPPPDAVEQEVPMRETAPNCAGCHSIMDPIGRIFDAYDDHGALLDDAWGDARVDVGSDVDGDYAGAVEFAEAVAYSDHMVDCFVSMWFRYALSRRVTTTDLPSFEPISADLAAGGSVRAAMLDLMAAPAFRTLYIAPDDQFCQ